MDTGKALDKIQHANKIKMFNKGSMEGNIFRLIKEIWLEKKTKKQNNPILDLKRCFPPDVEKKKKNHSYWLLLLLFNTMPKDVAISIVQERKLHRLKRKK